MGPQETGRHIASEGEPHAHSEYMFLKKDTLLSPEAELWLKTHTVGHLSPLWLAKPRRHRRYGGAEDVVLNIVNGLADFGVKKQELCGNELDKELEELPNTHVIYPEAEVFRGRNLYRMLQENPIEAKEYERYYVISSYLELLKRKDELGVVHDHTSYGLAQAYRISPHVPVVRTEHGPVMQPYLPAINEAILEILKDTPNVWFIAISQTQYEQRPDLPWIAVVHNGIDLRDFEFAAAKKGHPEYGQYLLYLGRISPEKGVHEAIKIANDLDMSLIIAGEVEKNDRAGDYFAKVVAPDVKGKIHYDFPNGANTEERKELMRDASAFLMPISWHEPFGMVMVEAMASGTPVVGYNIGSVPELVVQGKTGYIVEDSYEAVSAVQEILAGKYDPFECRRVVEYYYSRHVMVRNYAEVYLEASRRFTGESQDTEVMVFSRS